MSCNGCRVLRKGCSDACILRPCLQWIDSPASQAHATVFVAKFFGRAGLLSFLSSVPPPHRPALFQSLLFEACGRAVNPVGGAVGLLWTGRWDVCQAAVDTILNGGAIHPVADAQPPPLWRKSSTSTAKDESCNRARLSVAGLNLDLDLSLTMPCFTESMLSQRQEKRRRPASPSEVSVTTSADSNLQFYGGGDRKLLGLFV